MPTDIVEGYTYQIEQAEQVREDAEKRVQHHGEWFWCSTVIMLTTAIMPFIANMPPLADNIRLVVSVAGGVMMGHHFALLGYHVRRKAIAEYTAKELRRRLNSTGEET